MGFTSGTTRDPKGVVHSHRTIGCETRQLDHLFPAGGPPQITGAPVGHFIGMLNAFLVPMLRLRPVNLIDARQKWPESLHVVDELPRTPSGKVHKFHLRQRLRDGSLGTS